MLSVHEPDDLTDDTTLGCELSPRLVVVVLASAQSGCVCV